MGRRSKYRSGRRDNAEFHWLRCPSRFHGGDVEGVGFAFVLVEGGVVAGWRSVMEWNVPHLNRPIELFSLA